jgi:hypothetical protein
MHNMYDVLLTWRCSDVKPKPGTNTLVLLFIGCIVFLIFSPLPAGAIKVGGSIYMGSIAPGSSAVHTMNISTSPGDPPMDLTMDILGLGQSLQQTNTGIAPELDTSPYSARSFITVIPQTFHLEPGASQEVKATINVPQNAGAGGRYAMITVHNAPTGSGSTQIVTAISIPMVITLAGTPANMTGKITNLSVADPIPGQPIKIITTLKNTGNFHYKVKTNVSITDAAGKSVAIGGSDVSARSIVPPFTGEFETIIATPLKAGTYNITSTAIREDGTVLDTKTIPYEIKGTYVPPADEATVNLTPKAASVLKTTDGRFTINFPAGAVVSDASVSIKPFSKDMLPPAPNDAKLGATTFKIDGLTGLLSKDATVVVKYSSADLEAAGSDVSKLTLARYDESDNKWTIVPTTVDKNALTLTATTNRFSIWAVMVTSGGSSGGTGSTSGSGTGKPGLGLDSTLVFAALGLTIMFVGIHRVRKP